MLEDRIPDRIDHRVGIVVWAQTRTCHLGNQSGLLSNMLLFLHLRLHLNLNRQLYGTRNTVAVLDAQHISNVYASNYTRYDF
jgi:hypothetical protein